MNYRPDYELLKCDQCDGTIGSFDRLTCYNLGVDYTPDKFICNRCGKEFKIYRLKYDRLVSNDKTGWLFPALNKEVL